MSQSAAIAPRPQPQHFQPIEQAKKIDDILKHPDMIKRFTQAMPRHLSTERMLRVCMLAVNKTPKLAECDIWSLTGAMLSLASLGLEPNTTLGHAYLIPFEKTKYNSSTRTRELESVECQVVIGYRGLIDLARRSGNLVSLHADVVYEGDEFSFEYGSNMHLKHVPMGQREKPLWVYAHAKLTDGEAFEVLPYNLVMKVRDQSEGFKAATRALDDSKQKGKEWRRKSYDASPWVAHEHEMAAKTMVRRIAKMLPMSIEFMTAVDLDSKNDISTFDYGSIVRLPDPTAVIDQVAEVVESAPEPEAAAPAETAPKPDASAAGADPALAASTPAASPETAPSTALADQTLEDAPFTIITTEGEVLPHDAYETFVEDMHKEMGSAAALGKASLEGFWESNALAFAKVRADDRKVMQQNYDTMLKSFEPREGKLV